MVDPLPQMKFKGGNERQKSVAALLAKGSDGRPRLGRVCYFIHFWSMRTSVSISSGFDMWSFMPEAWA